MKTLTQTVGIALLGMSMAISLTACNSRDESAEFAAAEAAKTRPRAAAPVVPAKCYDCGTITSIEQLKVKGEGTGIGAVIGAVAGAAAGRQVGDGRGQDAATVAGAVGGGMAGHEIEKRMRGTTYYRVTVAMESGGTRTADVESLNGLTTGSKVKVIGNNLQIAGN